VEHVRLSTLPKTDEWNQVVSLISSGANIERIAAATATAAEPELARIYEDEGLTHSFYLLTRILQVAVARQDFPERLPELGLGYPFKPAAEQPEFPRLLSELGLSVPNQPTFLEIVAAFIRATDLKRLSIWKRERRVIL
jgi:hypothetical protein